MQLEDGRVVTGDLLVGADGIWSKIRKQMIGETKANYSGYTCYTGPSAERSTGCAVGHHAWLIEAAEPAAAQHRRELAAGAAVPPRNSQRTTAQRCLQRSVD